MMLPKNIRTLIERFLLSHAYFILFSMYPVLWMFAYNVYDVHLTDLFRPFIISLLSALLLFEMLQLVIRHPQTSALTVLFIFFSFFIYGHFRNSLNALGVFVQDNVLAVAWFLAVILVSVLIGYYARRWKRETVAVTMNLMTIILLLFPITRLLVYAGARAIPLDRKTDQTIKVDVNSASPDVYYIILDAYTRTDVMKDRFGYDNSSFIRSLENMGFYVAKCSQTNYGTTSLSLSSTLNMDYLQNISNAYQPKDNDLLYAFEALDSNAVRNTLTNAGYETVVFASGFNWIEWRNAEHFLSAEEGGITEFEVSILFSTYARILDDFGIVNLDDNYAEHYRQRTRFVLDSFDELLDLPSPKFVFIHIIAPHEPYGLDKNGNNILPDRIDPVSGYGNQAEFISRAILPRLKMLISESANPPVIILQGDHGWLGGPPEDLMKILNAYYLPGHTDQLYPSISPVNSFRVVFNSYFGANFPLLKDVSYYSSLSRKYDFKVMPNTCP